MLTMTTLRRLWTSNAPLTAAGLLMMAALVALPRGALARSPRDHRRPGVAQARQVRRLDHDLHVHAGLDVQLPPGLAAPAPDRRLAYRCDPGPRGQPDHASGVARDDESFQRRHAARRCGVRRMAAGIVVQTATSVAVTVALWRQPFADRALGWALRLGMVISLLGASTGGLMTQPTAAQLADARAGHRAGRGGRPYRRRRRRRARTPRHRVEPAARRSARPALSRPARDADAAADRAGGRQAVRARRRGECGWSGLPASATARCLRCCWRRRFAGKRWPPRRRRRSQRSIVWASGTAAAAWIARGGAAPLRTSAAVLG